MSDAVGKVERSRSEALPRDTQRERETANHVNGAKSLENHGCPCRSRDFTPTTSVGRDRIQRQSLHLRPCHRPCPCHPCTHSTGAHDGQFSYPSIAVLILCLSVCRRKWERSNERKERGSVWGGGGRRALDVFVVVGGSSRCGTQTVAAHTQQGENNTRGCTLPAKPDNERIWILGERRNKMAKRGLEGGQTGTR